MNPILVRFSDTSFIYSGHFMLFLGGLAAIALLAIEMKRTGERPEEIYGLLLLLFISAVAGARLLFCVDFHGEFRYSLADVLKFWKGGLALHGGILLALATFILYTHWRRLDFWRMADLFAPATALFISFARVGCILMGCCYGKPCNPDFPLAITFTKSASLAPRGVPLYPTQVMFAAVALLVFVLVWVRRRRKRFEGELALIGASLFSFLVFLIEFFRADRRVLYEIGGSTLSQNQIVGAVLFLAVTGLYFYRRAGSASSHKGCST
jgi:phosphatidylglycerol:prolipoprotein diacylglycerol transferase